MALPRAVQAEVYAGLRQINDDVTAKNLAGAAVQLSRSDVQALADSLRGPLLLAGNPGYDLARQVLNPAIDRHPALIVQPGGVADISRAVAFAAEQGLVVAVKCGGHSFAGKSTCEGGLQIDLSRFRHVQVDAGKQLAQVSGGSLLGAMDHETMAHGLVTTAGTVSHTGVGGLATGGGFGRLARRFGLALDNIASVDVVTGDGSILYADSEQNPDLYWGVRGAGSNFGVVTRFAFHLHPVQRRVMGGSLTFGPELRRQVLEFYAEHCANFPDELYVDCTSGFTPDKQQPFTSLHLCYSGPAKSYDTVMAPIRGLGKPVRDTVKSIDYVAEQRRYDLTDPRAMVTYVKGGYVSEIPAALVNAILDGLEPDPERYTRVYFQHSGGAIGRVAADATAFPHRYAIANMLPMINYPPTADVPRHVAWLKQYWKTLEPFTHGFYTVEADQQSAAEFNSNYLDNYPRLLAAKRRYDPKNLFRLNANITPEAAGGAV